jgi:hypothetical protein
VDEGIARPILLGPEDEVERATERLHVDLSSVPVIDPARSPRLEAYAEEYFRMRRRRGVLRDAASRRLRQPDYYAAMMVLSGDADMMIAGVAHHYVESLRMLIEVIGPAPETRRVSSHYLVLLPDRPVLLADCAINIEPEAEDLAETALLASRMARALGIDPRVAMLSFSNFGSVDHPAAVRMQRIPRSPERAPGSSSTVSAARGARRRLQREHFSFASAGERQRARVPVQSGTLRCSSAARHHGADRPPSPGPGPGALGTVRLHGRQVVSLTRGWSKQRRDAPEQAGTATRPCQPPGAAAELRRRLCGSQRARRPAGSSTARACQGCRSSG